MNTALKSIAFGTALALCAIATEAWSHDIPRDEHHAEQRGPRATARFARAMREHPEFTVAVDLRRLEMLYRKQGNEAAIVAMYQDLQKRTDHPKLRARIDDKLAKLR